MAETIESIQQKLDDLKKAYGVGGYSIEKNAFFALCRIAELQTNRLNKFNLDSEITKDAKEDKVYDRTMAIVKELPKMISDINGLRKELNIGTKEMEQKLTRQITPESISDVLGNSAGQIN